MKTTVWLLSVWLTLFGIHGFAQTLQPGFDKGEYLEILQMMAYVTAEENYYKDYPGPEFFRRNYQSPSLGFDNLWQLWVHHDGHTAVIAIRGSTQQGESWLANLHAAMIPAQGEIVLGNDRVFNYNFSEHPHAAVHAGWTTATAFLSFDVLPKIDSLYALGVRDFLVAGHSQGGAICYLLTAHLYDLRNNGRLPKDIRLKSYASASPKPGNLYFAYSFEAMTQEGWFFNVVNASDWVPEVPLSIQTLEDFNSTNPFVLAKDVIKKQKFPRNVAYSYLYGRLNKPLIKARKRYRHYLGEVTGKRVAGMVPGYVAPDFYNSNNYVRTGTTIVLMPNEDYMQEFSVGKNDIFCHHHIKSYVYLANRLP